MTVILHMEPDQPPMSWGAFINTRPPFSMSLDGHVADGPRYLMTREGPYLCANHHEKVDRFSTLSTAQQILRKIRMGMDRAFTQDGMFHANVYANDCDQDVCAAVFLLRHIDMTRSPSIPLKRLIDVAGTLDVTAGAFPYDQDLQILGEVAWVFTPYTSFRDAGLLARRDPTAFTEVVDAVDDRIMAHVLGRGSSVALDMRYDTRFHGNGWRMIEELGPHGRIGAFGDGIDAFMLFKQVADDRWRYSGARRSEFIPFPAQSIVKDLNRLEARQYGLRANDSWGGADTTFGSPRIAGSQLSPEQVFNAVEATVSRSLGRTPAGAVLL